MVLIWLLLDFEILLPSNSLFSDTQTVVTRCYSLCYTNFELIWHYFCYFIFILFYCVFKCVLFYLKSAFCSFKYERIKILSFSTFWSIIIFIAHNQWFNDFVFVAVSFCFRNRNQHRKELVWFWIFEVLLSWFRSFTLIKTRIILR